MKFYLYGGGGGCPSISRHYCLAQGPNIGPLKSQKLKKRENTNFDKLFDKNINKIKVDDPCQNSQNLEKKRAIYAYPDNII